MSGYARTVLLLGVASAFLETALPLRRERTLPYVRFVIGLVTVLMLVAPVADVLRTPEKITDGIRSFFAARENTDEAPSEDAVLREAAAQIAEGIMDWLGAEYDIPREAARVTISLDAEDRENVRITGVTVKFRKDALPTILETGVLSARLSELVGAPVTIS